MVGDLIDFGSVKRAVLGIQMIDLSEALAKNLKYESVDDMLKKLKLSSTEGVYIDEVVKGGAADKAGIQKGDVLVAVGGQKVKNGSFMSVTTRLRCHSSCSRFVIGLSPAFIGTFPSGHSLVSAAGSCLQSSAMSAARASGVSVSAQ